MIRRRTDGWVFPERLRSARLSVGLTLAQVAEQMRSAGHTQFDTAIVSRLETGQREVSLKEAVLLAQIVGEPLDRLLDADALDTPPWSDLYSAVLSMRSAKKEVSNAQAALQDSTDRLRSAAADAALPWTQALGVAEEAEHRAARGEGEPPSELHHGLLREAARLFESAKQTDRLQAARSNWPLTWSMVEAGQ